MSKKKESVDDLVENWTKQLRKGTLELAILSYIKKQDGKTYGYNLIKTLNDANIEIDGSTVYPILRRLEKKGLINHTWDTEKEQPKKYFKITETGNKALNELKREWSNYFAKIHEFIKNGG